MKNTINHIKNIYGEPSDVDRNGKIEIVFHKTQYMNGKAGYFLPDNVWKTWANTAEADILYISSASYMDKNAIVSNKFSSACVDTIIHELQHDMRAKDGIDRQPERWLNEALSVSTYLILHNGESSGRGYDFTYYNSIVNGKYFFDWQNIEDIENYRTAANFMYWLYIHGGGEQIIRDILNSNPNKRPDMKSIGDASRKNIPFFKNKNDTTVAMTWYKANFLNEANSIYGYKNRNPYLKIGQANAPSGKVSLSKYCAVYTTPNMYSANFSLLGKGIQMEKLKNSSGKEWLLIFNGSQNTIEVKINPNISRVRSMSAEIEEENEWFDAIHYLE